MRKILETERLILREFSVDDAENFYLLNLNPKVIKYTGDAAFTNVDEAKSFLENYQDYKKNGFGRWAVILKSNDNFIGWCGLKYDENADETDIGFRFFEEYWSQGFATESAAACLKYGFENFKLNNIVGRAMLENAASIKVLEKIGLKFTKEFDFCGQKGVLYSIQYQK